MNAVEWLKIKPFWDISSRSKMDTIKIGLFMMTKPVMHFRRVSFFITLSRYNFFGIDPLA